MLNQIGVVGAGAVGCSLASALFETYGDRVCFVARSQRGERLSREGVTVNSEKIMIPVCWDSNPMKPDVLMLCVKNYSLEQTLEDIRPFVSSNTVILPLLNGVTAVGKVRKAFPDNPVPYGIVLRTNAERINHNVTVTLRGEIQIGFGRGEAVTCDLEQIRDMYRKAGINSNIYEDMRYMQWRKWMVNIGANQVSALTDAKFKYFGQISEITVLLRASIQEILEIAKKKNVGLTEQDREDIVEMLINYPPEKKTSMLQDIEARRKTEIDYFAGTVIALGEEVGVPTPVNRVMYYALKAREQVGLAEKQAAARQ